MAHFSIEGTYLVDTVRGFVLEGRWRHGLRTLTEGLPGMTTDQAIQILKGEKTLIGVNDVEFVDQPQDDKELKAYLDTLDFQMGRYVRYKGTVYEPYAQVTSLGYHDVNSVTFKSRTGRSERKRQLDDIGRPSLAPGAKRALHYADDQFADLVVFPGNPKHDPDVPVQGHPFLFRAVTVDVPLWIEVSDDFIAAIEGARGLGIEERGHAIRYPAPVEDLPDHAKPKRPKRATQADLRARAKAEEEREKKYQEKIAGYREAILQQAGEDLISHTFPDPIGEVRIPRTPLWNWAMCRTGVPLLPWENVCDRGLKMMGDDRNHTDWMVGAGIDLDHYSDEEFKTAQYDLLEKIQKEERGFEVAMLVVGKSEAYGRAVHPKPEDRLDASQIAIIPDASPRWYECVRNAAGIICQEGGAMSHLAVVGLEEGFLLARMKGAKAKLPEGTLLSISGEEGKIRIDAFDSRYSLERARQNVASAIADVSPEFMEKWGIER